MKLQIDHMFFTLSAVEFQKIVENERLYKCFRDVSTETSEASYRGLYLTFEDGTYLELLYPHPDFIDGTYGLALADFENNNILVSEFPSAETVKEKVVTHNGEFWYSLYDHHRDSRERVYIWVMQYSDVDLAKRKAFKKNGAAKLMFLKVFSHIQISEIQKKIERFSDCLNFPVENVEFVKSREEVVQFGFEMEGKKFDITFSLR